MDETDDLVVQLCTRIGMIMEDASVAALSMARTPADHRASVIDELSRSGQRIANLAEAARALLD